MFFDLLAHPNFLLVSQCKVIPVEGAPIVSLPGKELPGPEVPDSVVTLPQMIGQQIHVAVQIFYNCKYGVWFVDFFPELVEMSDVVADLAMVLPASEV